MQNAALSLLKGRLSDIPQAQALGRVRTVDGHLITIAGLENEVRLGDRLRVFRRDGSELDGEVLRIDPDAVTMLPDSLADQIALGDRVVTLGRATISPCDAWIGRVIDPLGCPLDQVSLLNGTQKLDVQANPPTPMTRKPLGPRIDTCFHVFNTMLPIARGQRIGVFAGPGVGKTTLLADLIKSMDVDLVVLALVGERGREIREFAEDLLGDSAMSHAIVVAASADAPPTERLRCSLSAMRVAEHFRDAGKHVLLVVDSVTRFAQAHREVAISAGEFPSLRGFPASTPSRLSDFVERAGPGSVGAGDITAIFSVLVPGADMDEPVADMLRGLLDGHVVLDRALSERGHFPAIDLLSSLSRALPNAVSAEELALVAKARKLAAHYHASSALVTAGLYTRGADPELDQAVDFKPVFEEFLTSATTKSSAASFESLALCIRRCGAFIDGLRSASDVHPNLSLGQATNGPKPQPVG